MNTKPILCLITLLLVISSLYAGTYSSDSGTFGDPYQITNLNLAFTLE